jgi:hypothetical protein
VNACVCLRYAFVSHSSAEFPLRAVATLFTMVQELTEVKRELTRMDKVTAACMSNARAGLFHGTTHCLMWRAVQVVYGKSRATTNGGMSWRMLAPSCSVLARTAVL